MKNAIVTSVLIFTCFLAAHRTEAGEWIRLPNSDGSLSCEFLFRGEIEAGDLTAVADISGWPECASARLVYLDSPGGDFDEVVSFLNSGLGAYSFPTHVRAGESCLSACAILFMYGRNSGVSSAYISRSLALGAELGFNAPFLNAEIFDQIGGEESIRAALEVSSFLLAASYSIDTINDTPMLPPEVIQIMLNTPSDEMYFVDTFGELEIFGIEHVGATSSILSERDFEQRVIESCISSYVFLFRQHFLPEGYDYLALVELINEIFERSDEFRVVKIDEFTNMRTAEERVSLVVEGPLYRPGPGSVGTSILNCELEIHMNAIPSGLEVSSYRVYFGRPDLETGIGLSRDFSGFSVGLVPVGTPHAPETGGSVFVSAGAMNALRRSFGANE